MQMPFFSIQTNISHESSQFDSAAFFHSEQFLHLLLVCFRRIPPTEATLRHPNCREEPLTLDSLIVVLDLHFPSNECGRDS